MSSHKSDNYQAPFTHPYKLNNGHPIQESANSFVNVEKLVTFSSASRDVFKYPSSSNFKIRLPSPIENIVQLLLYQHSIPIVFDIFSAVRNNIELAYTIRNPYKPDGPTTLLNEAIYECLISIREDVQIIRISNGFYNQQQMVTELTNKLNKSVSDNLLIFVERNLSKYESLLPLNDETYDRFVVVYNEVEQKIWFGNRADKFVLQNENIFIKSQQGSQFDCYVGGSAVSNRFTEWGLPFFLGLQRTNQESEKAPFVRFYYGNVNIGDNGRWLTPIPSLRNQFVYYVATPFKVNLLGPDNIYLKITNFNCIDAVLPFSLQNQGTGTNQGSGTKSCPNFALAVIPIAATPVTTVYGTNTETFPARFFSPPINRIEELEIRFSYINEEIVDFGNSDFTLTLKFVTLENIISRTGHVFNATQGLQPLSLIDTAYLSGRRNSLINQGF